MNMYTYDHGGEKKLFLLEKNRFNTLAGLGYLGKKFWIVIYMFQPISHFLPQYKKYLLLLP